MLILSRKENESIQIGDDVVITLFPKNKYETKVGIKAPKHVKILRSELADFNKEGDLNEDDQHRRSVL